MDDIAVWRRRVEARQLLGKRLAGAGQHIAVQQAGIKQVLHEDLNAAPGVDIDHREPAERTGIDDHRHDIGRQVVEFLGAHHIGGEIGVARGTGDFRRMQHDVGRATHRHRHDDGVADGFVGDDVTWLDVLGDHVVEAVDQLVGEFGQAAVILRRRRHHMKRLHADDADEGLHRVVGEHAATAAEARAGLQRDPALHPLVVATCQLVAGDDIDRLAGGGIGSRADRSVRHDHGRAVVLQDRGKCSNGRLVAGHDGDHALKAGSAQVLAKRIIGDLAPDQRIPHFLGAVADAVRGGDGEFRLHKPHRHLVGLGADTRQKRLMDGFHLGLDADIALGIPLVTDNADRRLVDQVHRSAEFARDAECLAVPAWILVDEDCLRIFHINPGV